MITFHLTALAWIFFRANNITDAFTLVQNLFTFQGFNLTIPEFGKFDFLIAGGAILFMEIVHLIERKENIRTYIGRKPIWIRWGMYYALTMAILLFGAIGEKQAFIYFQF